MHLKSEVFFLRHGFFFFILYFESNLNGNWKEILLFTYFQDEIFSLFARNKKKWMRKRIKNETIVTNEMGSYMYRCFLFFGFVDDLYVFYHSYSFVREIKSNLELMLKNIDYLCYTLFFN